MEEGSKDKKIEIFLRILAITVGSLAALISATVALGTFEYVVAPGLERATESPYPSYYFRPTLRPTESDESKDVLREIRGPISFVIFITAVAIMIEAAVIFTRLRFVGINITVLLSVVIGAEILLMAGHIIGGVNTAYYVDKHIFDLTNNVNFRYTTQEGLARFRDSMTAAAAFCFVTVFLFGFLVAWEIIPLIPKLIPSLRRTQ